MKFVLHPGSADFLICDSCGGSDFKLLPDKKLSASGRYKFFQFYECPNCRGAGFWAHGSSVDEKRQLGIALARCKAAAATGKVPAAARSNQKRAAGRAGR